MNKQLILLGLLPFLFINSSLQAQIGGNQVYRNQTPNYNRHPVETASIFSTDSTLVVTAKVLLNKKAACYLLTVGVNQTAKTVEEANLKSNTRIANVVKKIKSLGINQSDIYVDFISETKLYDHKVSDREITEYFDGFNIRRNFIIKTDQLDKIDKIIDYCAAESIYDIIKVDYVSEDLESINAQLLSEALKIAEEKKKVFEKNSSAVFTGSHRLASENLKIYYPKNLYRQYNEAFETSLVNTHYTSGHNRKDARKETTYYYDGIETEQGVNKIIDAIAPTIGIQYVIEVKVIYRLKKNKG